MTSRTLYTIGYEKALLKDVISTLAAAGISTLLDVRDRPISRRPGFSKRQLAAAIEEAGMSYLHLHALGTPPEGRLANRRREWIGSGQSWKRGSLAPKPNSLCNRPPGSPTPRRAACCATSPIGKSAIVVASPKSFAGATALRCVI
jgi:hypothetical protein